MWDKNGPSTRARTAWSSDWQWWRLALHWSAWQLFSEIRKMGPYAVLATISGFAVCESLGAGASETALQADTERDETKWEFSLATFTYLALHARDYVNPNFTADRDWLHLEARYNYEELKTGSVWRS